MFYYKNIQQSKEMFASNGVEVWLACFTVLGQKCQDSKRKMEKDIAPLDTGPDEAGDVRPEHLWAITTRE